ncbi:MAG: DUF4255 domain-containing protein [Algicola sp.]|nr:DUF4255 domain-containing protein [Algicola sp.]
MIDKALKTIAQVAEDYISQLLPNSLGEKKVVLTTFVDDAGNTQIPMESVGLSLLNIEQERTFSARAMPQLEPVGCAAPDQISFVHRPVDLNLLLMLTAHFSNYEESLRHISYIIQCFQANPQQVLQGENEQTNMQLVMELNTLPLEQQNNIWGMVGLRYLPSVVYRLRMLRIQDTDKRIVKSTVKTLSVQNLVKGVQD